MAESPSLTPPRRRWLRFSLRTLLLCVLLIGSSATLWWNSSRGRWALAFTVDEPAVIRDVFFSDDDKFVMFHYVESRSVLSNFNYLDIRRMYSGQQHALLDNSSGHTSACAVSGSFAAFYFETEWSEHPKGTPVTIFDWSDKRELNSVDNIKDDNTRPGFFELHGSTLLAQFRTKKVAYRLPAFEKVWEGYYFSKLLSDGRLWVQEGSDSIYDFSTAKSTPIPSPERAADYFEEVGNNPRYIGYGDNGGAPFHFTFDTLTRKKTTSKDTRIYQFSADGQRAIAFCSTKQKYEYALIDPTDGHVVAYLGKNVQPVFDCSGALLIDSGLGTIYESQTGTVLWSTAAGNAAFSGNGRFVSALSSGNKAVEVRDAKSGRLLIELPLNSEPNTFYHVAWPNHSSDFIIYATEQISLAARPMQPASPGNADSPERKRASVWHLSRPLEWYGAAYLPEFWLTLLLAFAFLWSLRRDRKILNAEIMKP